MKQSECGEIQLILLTDSSCCRCSGLSVLTDGGETWRVTWASVGGPAGWRGTASRRTGGTTGCAWWEGGARTSSESRTTVCVALRRSFLTVGTAGHSVTDCPYYSVLSDTHCDICL